MAPHTTHRRNLAPPDHTTPSDPTNKKLPKSTPTTTTTTKPHHPPNPDPTSASSTVHTISKRFSNLYSNHHKSLIASSKQSNPPSKPRIDAHLQAKLLSSSLIDESSTKPVTKSSQKQRKTLAETEMEKLRAAITGVIDQPKKSSKKESSRKVFYEVGDLKKQAFSMSRSLESGLKKVDDHEKKELNKRPSFSLTVTGGGGGGRRLSLCNSQTELADFLSCNGVKVVSVDMPPFMQAHAVDCSRKTYDSMEKFSSRVLASTLKKEFDGVYGPAWHCIVGTSFGSFVTHSVGGFLYFSMDHKIYVLLFKTTVQRAD